MLNTPNLAWSVALVPWVLAGESVHGIAIAFGLQALCGEPVTWAATGAIEAAVILVERRRWSLLAGLMLGALLAAAQLVPTMTASVRAHRAALATPDFWSLHPLSLWEVVAPHLFGNHSDTFLADLPWMGALNFGRDPFFYSCYVGPFVLVLACAGAARPRRNASLAAVALAFTLAALGGYTPFYPLLRRLVPALMYFRFPVKYLVFATFAAAVLAADAWKDGRALVWTVGGPRGTVLVGLTLALVSLPGRLHGLMYRLAVDTHLKELNGRRGVSGAAWRRRSRCAPAACSSPRRFLPGRRGGVRTRRWLLAARDVPRPARQQRRPQSDAGGGAAVAARLVHGGIRRGARLHRRTRARLHEHRRSRRRADLADSRRGRRRAGADGVERQPADGAVGMGRARGPVVRPAARCGPADYRRDRPAVSEKAGPAAERDAFLRRSGVRWCVLPVREIRWVRSQPVVGVTSSPRCPTGPCVSTSAIPTRRAC